MKQSREELLAKKRAYNAMWREKNRDYIAQKRNEQKELLAEKQRARYRENTEQYRASMQSYYERNKDKISAYQKEYREKNKDRIGENHRRYVQGNRKAIYARTSEWLRKNKDLRRVYCQNRRKKLLGKLSVNIVEVLMSEQSGMCCYCFSDISNGNHHIDHFVAIYSGGKNADENVVLACPSCNLKKSYRDPLVFVEEVNGIKELKQNGKAEQV